MQTIYIIVAIVIVLIVVLAVVNYRDIHSFVTRTYEVESDKAESDYTFALLSDLHGYKFGEGNEKLIKAIEEIDPDVVLCAGDMFDAGPSQDKLKTENGISLLEGLSRNYPVYIANGNHEQKIKDYTGAYGNFFDRYKARLESSGIVYLENESSLYDDGKVIITGLELSLLYFQKLRKKEMEKDYIEKKLGRIKASDADKLHILIAHNPIYFEEYANWGADLVVSGHVHGGIVRVPFLGGVISPAISLFPKYDGGLYKKGKSTMILSRGLGTHTIHVRLFNPCELVVIKVRKR